MRKVKYGDIGSRIKEARIRAGYKQKDCLKPLGDITAQMLSDWEHGYVCPSMIYLRNLSNFYGVSLDYIVFGKSTGSGEKDIRSYKDIAICMLALYKTGLFKIGSGDIGKMNYTDLITYDKTINDFREEFDNLLVAANSLKPQLFQQAVNDLLSKYDIPLKLNQNK